MKKSKPHEPPEVIQAYLDQSLVFTRRFCRENDLWAQRSALRCLRELFRARRSGWMTPAQEKRYEGLLKALRPQFLAIVEEGRVHVPPVVAAEFDWVRAKARRSARRRAGGNPGGADEEAA